MKISYRPTGINNFHNTDALNLRIDGTIVDPGTAHELYLVSKGQAKRIMRHFCGIKDCRCSAGSVHQLDPDGEEWAIPRKYCTEL